MSFDHSRIRSCSVWAEGAPIQEPSVLVPGKFLSENIWRRLEWRLPPDCKLILVLGDSSFDASLVARLMERHPIEIWLIPLRSHSLKHSLERLPQSVHPHLRFYFPLPDRDHDLFPTAGEIYRLGRDLARSHPHIRFVPPDDLDLFNPTLDLSDLELRSSLISKRQTDRPVDISVVIPSYNSANHLEKTVRELCRQNRSPSRFELIVVDDGSSDETGQLLAKLGAEIPAHIDHVFLHYPRTAGRKMGDNAFRAGLARTLGVNFARGAHLAFLDSDILVPPSYIEELSHRHRDFEVVQVQRLYLTREGSQRIDQLREIRPSDIFHPEGGYWRDFFADPKPWQTMPGFWKFTCTYGLSVKASLFHQAGGFRAVFNSYGFEDTDLGYRLYKAGARFHKSKLQVFHLWHAPARSEFGNSEIARHRLLKKSAGIFYRHNLDAEIYDQLGSLLTEFRPMKTWIRNLLFHPNRHIPTKASRAVVVKK